MCLCDCVLVCVATEDRLCGMGTLPLSGKPASKHNVVAMALIAALSDAIWNVDSGKIIQNGLPGLLCDSCIGTALALPGRAARRHGAAPPARAELPRRALRGGAC